jgi:hypothetical protein
VTEPAIPLGNPHDDTCFTRLAYAAMLETALAGGYRFIGYDEAQALEAETSPKLCILRHDIDVDPGAALELAEIEAARVVRGTYFVMTRSPVYNAFGRANQTMLRRIAELGHWIGLHYDVAFKPDDGSVEDWIASEAEILATMLGVDVRSVSFHQPMLGGVDARSIHPEGLFNAFDFPGFMYVSDANKAMPEGSFVRLFRKGSISRIHLCIHPLWWATEDANETVEALWDQAILANLRRSEEQMLATERGFGPARVWSVSAER